MRRRRLCRGRYHPGARRRLPRARGQFHARLERAASRDARQHRRAPRRCLPRFRPPAVAPQGPRGRLTRRTKLGRVAQAFHDSCLAELEALKPGNMHRFADGHRMSVEDFEKSAAAAAPAIGRPRLPVGKRILRAVEATNKAAGQNTNLGIVLLAAPLATAVLDREGGDLKARVGEVLETLTVEDARDAYRAIRMAAPGGL